jgi:glycosyltransferase involved in cell wall biosynthesis
MRVCALTAGRNSPASRFRWRQHVPCLEGAGIETTELHVVGGSYPPQSHVLRPFWLAANLVDAFRLVRRANEFDIRFLQRSLISTLCTSELKLKSPLVLDVDDAVFLNQRFSGIDRIAAHSSLVICGNGYLADHFGRFAKTTILPTAVDTDRYFPTARQSGARAIGWSGLSSGFGYLRAVEPALKAVLDRFPDVTLRIIAEHCPSFPLIDRRRIDFRPWHPDTEVAALQDLTVGIMPLTDGPWEQGKCSFKMLTYMAVGVPVVVSAVGMNRDVMNHGRAGLLAASHAEWVDALCAILEDEPGGREMGREGRRIVDTHYAAKIVGPKLASILTGLVAGR